MCVCFDCHIGLHISILITPRQPIDLITSKIQLRSQCDKRNGVTSFEASNGIISYYLQSHDKVILSKDSDLSHHRSTFEPNKKVVEISTRLVPAKEPTLHSYISRFRFLVGTSLLQIEAAAMLAVERKKKQALQWFELTP